MNIEIANQLLQLRKQHGFSQEQLAEKLGISRQAVSKWERAEASPDTDNLVMLAKLYGVSLDELLLLVPIDDNAPDPAPNSVAATGRITNLRSWLGARAQSTKQAAQGFGRSKWFAFPYIFFALLLFAATGYLLPEGWRYAWLWLLSVPIYYSLGLAVERKNGYFFLYPVLVTLVYVGTCLILEFGMLPSIHLWGRLWVLYLTSFLYYYLVYYFRKKKRLAAQEASDED